jgi:hypothetical protein
LLAERSIGEGSTRFTLASCPKAAATAINNIKNTAILFTALAINWLMIQNYKKRGISK